MRIFVIGYMASGKTRFGKLLAKALGLQFFDLDQVVFARTQRSASDWIRQDGEEAFRKIELLCLLYCLEQDNFVLATGGGTPCFFTNMERMNKAGITLWLQVPFGRILQRLSMHPGDRPLVVQHDHQSDAKAIENHYNNRVPFYEMAQIRLATVDTRTAVELIRNNLKSDL